MEYILFQPLWYPSNSFFTVQNKISFMHLQDERAGSYEKRDECIVVFVVGSLR